MKQQSVKGDIAMPKNKIQFQKGLSLQRFHKLYGTEEQCRALLFKYRWPNGFICPKCGHKHFYQLTARTLFQCCTCRFQSSLISGTIFESTKLPLTTWFLAIYLITQSKDGISSLSLSRCLGISANASLRMKHKLQQVMKEADDAHPLNTMIQIDDAYWGGKKHDGVRGRGATGKTPFIAAVSTNLQGHPLFMRLSRIASFSSCEIKRWASKHIHHHSLVLSDGLRGFNGIAAAGISYKAITTGGGYESMSIPAFTWVNIMLGNVKRSLHGTYHAVSQKHLPRYLAEFCYRFNRRFDLGQMINSLAFAAVNSKPIPQHRLMLAEEWW
jgi:transposase-like protein